MLYYGFLIVALLVFAYIVSPDFMPDRSHRWLYLCYLANWLPHAQWHVLAHFWSLCGEEQFYFVSPLLILLVSPRRLLPIIVALELTLVCGRSWFVFGHSHIPPVYATTVARVDGLLLGVACAVLVREFRLQRCSVAALPWVAVLFLATFVAGYHWLGHSDRHLFEQSVGFALLAISFAAFVLFAALAEGPPGWQQTRLHRKPLVLFGKYSYGICVFHYPIFYFAERRCRRLLYAIHHTVWFAYLLIGLECATSFIVASPSYNFCEKRFLALKDRFAPVCRPMAVAGIAPVPRPMLPLTN